MIDRFPWPRLQGQEPVIMSEECSPKYEDAPIEAGLFSRRGRD
ncbi:MAG TPA: hypothetical protein VIN77_02925 [Aurantimonas sp.]|nr:hypothetical protein [Aurantimonas marianensis]